MWYDNTNDEQGENDMDECCPWCGEDYNPVYGSFDAWLEGHVMECEPYLQEQEPSSGPR